MTNPSRDGAENGEPDRAALETLGRQIEAAQAKARGEGRDTGVAKYAGVSLAWRMVVELLVGMALGLWMGWALDEWLGTMPVFLLIFGLLGFAAGVVTMLRSAKSAGREPPAA